MIKCFAINFVKFSTGYILLNTAGVSVLFLLIKHSAVNFTEAKTRGVLYEKSVLKNFAKLTRKHLCRGLLFNKVTVAQMFS